MNIFGYPYWQFNADGNIVQVAPSGIPGLDELEPSEQELLTSSIPSIAPGMAGTPFFEIVVKNSPLGGSLITWGMKRGFADPLPYRFDVYWSETPTGPFEHVDTPVLINTYWASDPSQRLFALDVESYYAIRLRTPNGEYWSYASNANATWNKKTWLTAREICRKEFLMCRKFTGWAGLLLKRKIWGAPCPRCKDFDTQEPSDGHCPVCYGTGKEGGYWAPFPTFTYNMGAGPTQFKQVDDNASLSENTVLPTMRMLGYPHLATNDVFVHFGAGRRFFVRPVKIASELKSIPIVYTCELRLAPYTDIIYEFPKIIAPPIPPEPPEPPSSEPTYVQPPAIPVYKIQWVNGEWALGLTPETSLYRTAGGYPLPNALDSFTWVKADGSAAAISVAESLDGYMITGDPEILGFYQPIGNFSGLAVFERTEA